MIVTLCGVVYVPVPGPNVGVAVRIEYAISWLLLSARSPRNALTLKVVSWVTISGAV